MLTLQWWIERKAYEQAKEYLDVHWIAYQIK